MNKGELVDQVAADAGITKAAAKVAVDSVFDSITKAIKKGDRVQITNGLNPGDHLIVRGHTEIEDGMKVNVQ